VPVREIHHACLGVSDLERSIAFYEEVLGFRVTVAGDFDDEGHVEMMRLPPGGRGRAVTVQPRGVRTGTVELIEMVVPGREGRPPARPQDLGVFMLAFEVVEEDLAAACARMEAAGVEFWSRPIVVDVPDFGRIESVVCEDPDGTMIELLTLPSEAEIKAARAALKRRD
jgi:glyoxylase I family protein